MKSLIIKTAKKAGEEVLKHYNNIGRIKFKNPRSIVTKADILSEKVIIKTISEKFPKHSFLSEEIGSINKNSDYTWIIDPIDGTTNFVSRIPYFSVCIALAKNNEVIMGAVYNPLSKEMFFAEKGVGSYLNNKKLKVSNKNNLENSILGFSLPNDVSISRKALSILEKTYGTFRGLRNLGSASLNLCYVATSQFDLYFTFYLDAWDVAAAKLVVEEAGGKVTNLNGKKWGINDKNIVASNGILHEKLLSLLK